ncbi:MAG: GNAT family N-acetyltransferase [Ekhidna sp.]
MIELFKPLKTRRLSLRELKVEDYAFIKELVNSKGWLQFIGDRKVHDEEGARLYIQNILNDSNCLYWIACNVEQGTPLGAVTLIQRDNLSHPDIGFAFLPRFSGQGYALEAATAVVEHLKCSNLDCILAITQSNNLSSIRLIEKLGMLLHASVGNQNEYRLELNPKLI